MPESICLHIQDRESGPIRVVEIPWISVRIGCAAYCEVRLADLELAEEACRLQRRGRTWHLVPLGPKGSILVQDRPIEGPYPLPFDVPFRIGSICFTLRQNRSSDPDWEMYRTLSSAQHRRPMSINPLPVSLPAVERCIASIAPPRSQRGIVHESSIPLAPRIESPLERSTSPRPVNPWEARWKAAGARLQAERKQPLPPGRPHPSPPADRYQSVPLKEPSVPLSRKAEPAVSPSRSREFSTHPLTPAAAPGYPVPPSISPRSRLDANLPIKAPTQPAEPSIATVRLEKITTRDRQPASACYRPKPGNPVSNRSKPCRNCDPRPEQARVRRRCRHRCRSAGRNTTCRVFPGADSLNFEAGILSRFTPRRARRWPASHEVASTEDGETRLVRRPPHTLRTPRGRGGGWGLGRPASPAIRGGHFVDGNNLLSRDGLSRCDRVDLNRSLRVPGGWRVRSRGKGTYSESPNRNSSGSGHAAGWRSPESFRE